MKKYILVPCQIGFLLFLWSFTVTSGQTIFSFKSDSSRVTEPKAGRTTHVVYVQASAIPTTPMQLTVTDQLTGDASATLDYTFSPNPAVLTFGPGFQQVQSVVIEMKADTRTEDSETIDLLLNVPSGSTLGAIKEHAIQILDVNKDNPPLSPFRIAIGSNFDYLNQAAELKNLFFGFEVFAPTAFTTKNNWRLSGFNMGFAWSQNFTADSSGNFRAIQNQALSRISSDCTLVRTSQYTRTTTQLINNFNFFASHIARYYTNDVGTIDAYISIRFEGIRRNITTNYSYNLDTAYTTRSRIPTNRFPPFYDITKRTSQQNSYYDFYLSIGFPIKWEPASDAVELRFSPMIGYGWFQSPFHRNTSGNFERFFYGAQLSIIEKKFGLRIGGDVRGSIGSIAPYYTLTLSKVFTLNKLGDYLTLKKDSG